MDPRYMDNYEFDSLSIAPLQHKKSFEIKASHLLLRLVSLLRYRKKLGWGERTIWQTIFETNQVNT